MDLEVMVFSPLEISEMITVCENTVASMIPPCYAVNEPVNSLWRCIQIEFCQKPTAHSPFRAIDLLNRPMRGWSSRRFTRKY